MYARALMLLSAFSLLVTRARAELNHVSLVFSLCSKMHNRKDVPPFTYSLIKGLEFTCRLMCHLPNKTQVRAQCFKNRL